MDENKFSRLSIQIDKDLKETLASLAADNHMSLSCFVRKMIIETIEKGEY